MGKLCTVAGDEQTVRDHRSRTRWYDARRIFLDARRDQRIGQRMLEKLDGTTVPESLQAYVKVLMSAVADPVIKSAQASAGEVDFVLPSAEGGGQNGAVTGEVQ